MEEEHCRLCLKVQPLQRSHLLPKALFRLLRMQSGKNPNPVMFTSKAAWTSSTQFADELLCADCEQLFHRNGEDWVLRHCYRGRDRFRLRQMIAGISPVSLNVAGLPFSPAQANFIPTGLVPGMEMERLAYFAASIIWRAGVHKWVVDERYDRRAHCCSVRLCDFVSEFCCGQYLQLCQLMQEVLLPVLFGKQPPRRFRK